MATTNIHALKTKAQALLDGNRVQEARAVYRQISEIDETNADAWFMLGVINAELGLAPEAMSCLQRAVEEQPDLADAHLNLGHILFNQGKFSEAVGCCRRAIGIDPEYAEAWLLLGVSDVKLGDYESATFSFRKAVSLWPDSREARMNLANVLRTQGHFSEAITHYQHLVQQRPDDPDVWTALAETLRAARKHAEAFAAYQKALSTRPDNAQLYNGLAELCLSMGKFDDAARACSAALRLNPEDAQALSNLGTALQAHGKLSDALGCLREAVRLEPNNPVINYKVACILEATGAPDEALRFCQRATELKPDFVEAHTAIASIYEHQGKFQEAREVLEPLLQAGYRNPHLLTAYASIAPRIGLQANAIDLLSRSLERNDLSPAVRMQIHNALGNLHEAEDNFDAAFSHQRRSNELKQGHFDPDKRAAQVDRIVSLYTPEFFSGAPRATNRSKLPIFIVGMPRSGTTLVEQILASHPDVYGAGELPDIMQVVSSLPKLAGSSSPYPECLREISTAHLDRIAGQYLDKLRQFSAAALRVTDKMPHNFEYLGLIQLLFPRARIIHVIRDPLDTCVSCYFQEFSVMHAYAYDLRHLGFYYQQYERLMRHWESVLEIPIIHVRYEDVVFDQKTATRRLISFCDLSWNDQCLRFFESKRHVATPSYDQVRQPLYTKSIGRWKNYEQHLSPLIEALGSQRFAPRE